jgi:sugar O-acyltransferase (sialic acid O-acetyltransferase NeuD family)
MKCILIGAGGHGRVLIEAYEPAKFDAIIGPQIGLKAVLGVPVLGGDEKLPQLFALGFTHFVIGVGSSKNCALRAALFERAVQAGLQPQSVIHPTAWISKSAQCAAGCQMMPRAVIHSGARLGNHVLVNTAAVVEHDCVVGAHSHIATGAILCGDVHVGEGAHIGAGAVIRQGIRIGAAALVAAGAVVVQDVPAGQAVAGVPARPMS